MSRSKLESLPNEILYDIIEKYINEVDLLRAFSYQLNQRFDAIFSRSQRLCFNFIQRRKDDFRICMGLLLAYMDKIEPLAISERDTPGQVEAFLSFFPSFDLFRQLRTLYFDFDCGTVARNNLARHQSNVEYLTVSGMNFTLDDLGNIFKLARRLKYLHVENFDQGCSRYGNTKRDLKRLAVDNIDKSLLQWLTKYVNCGGIKELIITSSKEATDALNALRTCVTNMDFLCVSVSLLVTNINVFVASNNRIRHLDISHCEHTFNEQGIILICKYFPYIEHLNINSKGLYNVPLIKKYLKYLRSLTFEMKDYYNNGFDEDSASRRLYYPLQRTEFRFLINNPKMTVWMDQAAFDDSYWQNFALKPSATERTNIPFSRLIL
ncbi:unnamed protein product [Rotaria magnacalcarata]|uniref:F-box domain-containing protein n=3 Tax=Rotaria magnacalcarata TaxID=392030 RepID=A0A816L6F9_9BILA|nr:unnamed protein product [Rotaria magnacalcarata]